MTSQLTPYLTFDGNAREAMSHYHAVLGGELSISTFGDYGQTEGVDPDGVMHAHLETPEGLVLMASDNGPNMDLQRGNNITVSIAGDDASLRDYFAGLAEGGVVTMPLATQVWGDEFGMLIDRFGIPWMVNISASQ